MGGAQGGREGGGGVERWGWQWLLEGRWGRTGESLKLLTFLSGSVFLGWELGLLLGSKRSNLYGCFMILF